MSYFFNFKKSDKLINVVKTYPGVSFAIYSGSTYYNNRHDLTGAFTSSILGAPPGYVSLYEQNIDRSGSLNFDSGLLVGADVKDPFGYAVANSVDPTDFYGTTAEQNRYGNIPNPRYATFKV